MAANPNFEDTEIASVLQRLFALKAQGPKYGIDRMRVLSAALGSPEQKVPCVHVAGTNGKGSVAAMLEAILREARWRTGLYTSPHLVHVGERVQVDRVPLTDAEIVAYTQELFPLGDRIGAEQPDLRPSFFEYMTAMAFLQFARSNCDIAVYEVGLGGRLDATNVVRPEVSVITSIGLDHCELLGTTLAQIAAEKAGIIKPSVPVVLGRMPQEAEAVIREVAEKRGSPVISAAERFGGASRELPRTNLAGEYQRWNAATATLAAEVLDRRWGVGPDIIRTGLLRVEWAGRWQRTRIGERLVVLDASHNPEGALALDENLAELVTETGRRPLVITGVLGTERAGPLLATIARHAAEIHLVVPAQPRACSFEQLERLVPRSFAGPVTRDALADLFPEPGKIIAGTPDDIVVVTGSIYLLGEVLTRLTAR